MIDRSAVLDNLDNENSKLVDFAMSYAGELARRDPDFPIAQLERFAGRPVAQARLLLVMTDLPTAWAKAEELGAEVEEAYWRRFSVFGRGNFTLVDEAARGLLDHGRVAAALTLMNIYLHGDRKRPDPSYVFEGLNALGSADEEESRLSGYEIEGLVQYLRETNYDEDSVARLEWRLLPALGHEPRGLFLERKLARDPAFFVEILSLCFRPKDSDDTLDVPSHVATNAYRLLSSWHTIPGSDPVSRLIDADALRQWYATARPLLVEANRLDIGEQIFGQTLAHAPADDDGLWPHRIIREFIEATRSKHVEIGFRIECFNKCGVVTRSLDEGGRQEYALAEQYAGWANGMSVTAPRTAAVLRDLAEGYRSDAVREDEEARRRLEGFED